MPIPANDFPRMWRDVEAEAVAVFREVGAGGWYILGPSVRAFEQALARTWGLPYACGVASGLDALEIALRALGCGPGARVLTTPVSAFATTLAIVRLGAEPVFADIDEYGLIDLAACREAFARDPDLRWFVPVHLYGHALDPARLRALHAETGCVMVEDCAQSIGTPSGLTGEAAATSFYPTKNLGALGDGGALLTRSEAVAAAARALRDYGQTAKYRHAHVGWNSRLDELHAALLHRVFLPRLDGWTARRREIAAQYLAGIRNPAIRMPGAPPGAVSSWHLFPVLVDDRAALLRHLRAEEITGGEHYPVAIPDQPVMQTVRWHAAGSLERARAWCRAEVSLPIHPYLTDLETSRVIEACNRYSPGR